MEARGDQNRSLNEHADIVTQNQRKLRQIKDHHTLSHPTCRPLIERVVAEVVSGALGGWGARTPFLEPWILESKGICNTIEKCEQRGDIDGLGNLFIAPSFVAQGGNVFRRIFMRRKREDFGKL